jgi:predicted nucleotidyltransferase
VSRNPRASQRMRVAREAANLLYTRQAREYRQAKLQAAENLSLHVLPSNAEVAAQLDQMAEEREGAERQKGVVQKRREAYQIMQALEDFDPVLVGSVWRGTARLGSDIDIVVYPRSVQQAQSRLREGNYLIARIEEQRVTKNGREKGAIHIHVKLPSGHEAEIVVRSPEEVDHAMPCEIYGDMVTGLTIKQLRKVLEENPSERFLPRQQSISRVPGASDM